MSIGQRIRVARKRAGLSGAELAQRAGLGVSTVSELEHGKREPSLSQIRRLAEATERSITFFLEEGPPPGESVLWRQRPENAPQIESCFIRFCEDYHRLEVWTDERRPTRLPEIDKPLERFDFADASALAKATRDQLQLGDFPGLTLLTALEEVCGVKVLHLGFQPTGTAASVVSETFGAGILLNSENARWRRNFDLAHELFHLLTWRQFRERGSSDSLDVGGKEEQLADSFASALLIPEEPLRNLMEQFKGARGIPISSIFDVARRFDVSTEALLWRIHNLFRSRDRTDQTRRDIERVQRLSTVFEKRNPDPAPEKPERFRALAVSALRNGEISIGRFAQLVGASRQQAMKFLEQDGPDDREATLVLT